MPNLAKLSSRGVVAVTGADRIGFLQGLVSNDVAAAAPHHAVWSALLTPQGRYLAEFFIFAEPDLLLLDAPVAAIPDLIKRLSRFRLRMKAEIADASDRYAVYASWDGPPLEADVVAPDPRLAEAGYRGLATATLPGAAAPGAAAPGAAAESAYLAHRLRLGLPDHADLEPDKTLLLEAGFDELHGVSWDKGCYMGQELTARTRYRGLVRRRLIPVAVDGPLPALGTPVLAGDREVGTMRTGCANRGLAILRLDALHAPLKAGDALLHPEIPAWMKLPEREKENTAP